METAFALGNCIHQNNCVLCLWARRLRHLNGEGAHRTLSHQCACTETCLDKQPEIFSILILQYNCDIKVGEEPGNETSRQPRSVVDAVLGGCRIGALGRSLAMRQPRSLVDAVLGGCHIGALGRSLAMRQPRSLVDAVLGHHHPLYSSLSLMQLGRKGRSIIRSQT